ncbi:FimV/HubP family polar landmark protein [Luteimonas sp. M1R5S18]|uniref:FimV/HubP family polar landmark protein n=1 Tax=Luteimonas rhizosphaericola TaxID=3042024 RepID=A0ABT6JFI6_9GAMM|nr:FimV/HubP family polar landmark protein [Luteimonas rhizosphaericola]MDH5829451.1 FimV/HubP family polar landmark protein [Luteimonas rhizosphaericola]
MIKWAGRLAALCLLLQCQVALALGLGQVEVRSRAGEPLLAEIPIISTDPAELENLQARLASPETFRRIGLDPPTGLVSDLRFAVALDAQGRPVIRITTDVPVQQPVLNFLVEVEWGQGRLVREYSALVDTPQTVAAPAQPPIQAPQAAPSNLIERPAVAAPAEPAPADTAAPTPEEARADDAVADSASDAPAPQPAPAPAPPAVPSAPPAAVAATTPGEIGPVQRGQTLGQIASELSTGSGNSLNQVMLALLRENPEAFIGGNLNLIRQGAVLRVPATETWSDASVAEANALVRDHVSRWRELRRPVAQPDSMAGAPAPAAEADGAPADASAANAGRVAEARLEIVPAAAGASANAGTRTGTAAGGEGDMLQQQELVQTRETLAARDAEVEELRTRLAELEQLQQQQAQLIAMKDSELAAAQQRLAESNARPTTSVGDAAPGPEASAGLPWLWIGLGLVAAALLVAWLVSRRRPTPARKGGPSFASAPGNSTPRRAVIVPAAPASPAADPPVVPVERASTWQAPPAAASGASPTWHASGETREPEADDASTAAPVREAVTQHQSQSQGQAQGSVPQETVPPASAGHERIELARAYLDLGDTDTARSLLQEVADAGDADARDAARQLLRELA